MSKQCVNNANSFCYACGELTFKSQRRNITPMLRKAYELYFEIKIKNQDKPWAPHICCSTCAISLNGWLRGEKQKMRFAVPMIWKEPKDHSKDCYLCNTKIAGISPKSKHTVQYPNLPSAVRPIEHSKERPVPKPPHTWSLDEENSEHSDSPTEEEQSADEKIDDDPQVEESVSSTEPQLISQAKLKDLVRDLNLTKPQTELLASRLKEWNHLESDVNITNIHKQNGARKRRKNED
ncbi:UNVERIFIED_CONTAM: hypothetical protein RMT77_019028 [Armadillidium vulgare]